MGKKETFWLWNTLNVIFCPRTSWKNTMANGIKNNRFQLWVTLEKVSRDNNVNDHDNLMRKSKTMLGNHQIKWSEKQLLSTLSHVRKTIETKQGIRLWQPNEEINKLVRKKKCLNGTKNMETSILAPNDSWKRRETKITQNFSMNTDLNYNWSSQDWRGGVQSCTGWRNMSNTKNW